MPRTTTAATATTTARRTSATTVLTMRSTVHGSTQWPLTPSPILVTARGPTANNGRPTVAAAYVGSTVIVGRPSLITKNDFAQQAGGSNNLAAGPGGGGQDVQPANVVQMILNVLSDASPPTGAAASSSSRPLLWPAISQRPSRPTSGGFIDGANVIAEMQQPRPTDFLEGAEVIAEMRPRPPLPSDPEPTAGNDGDYADYYLDLYPDLRPQARPNATAAKPTVPHKPPSGQKPADFLEGPGIIPEMQGTNNNFLEGPGIIPEMQGNNNNFLEGPNVIPDMASTVAYPTTTKMTTTATPQLPSTTRKPSQSEGGDQPPTRPSYKPTVRPDVGFRPTSSPTMDRPPEGPTTTSKYRPTIQPAIMATYGPTISFLSPKVSCL